MSTETDIDTSTVGKGKGTDAGSMRLNGVGMAIAMIDMDMTRRGARPGNFGGPEKGRSGTRRIMFVTFCLLQVLFRVLTPGATSLELYVLSHRLVLFRDL